MKFSAAKFNTGDNPFSNLSQPEPAEERTPSVVFDDLDEEQQGVYADAFNEVYDGKNDDEASIYAEDKLFSWQSSNRKPAVELAAPLGIGFVPGDRLTETQEGRNEITFAHDPSIVFDNLNEADKGVYADAFNRVYNESAQNWDEASIAGENAIRAKYVNLTDNLLDDDTMDTLMGWEPGTAGNLTEDTKGAIKLVWQEYGKKGLERYMNGGTVEDRKYAPQNSRWREAEQMIGPAHGQQVRAEAGISDDWQTLGIPQKADRYMSPENALDQMYTLLDPEYEESGVAPTWDTLQGKLESIDDPALRDEVSIAYNNMRWAMDQGGTASREDLEQAYTALDNLAQYSPDGDAGAVESPQKADRERNPGDVLNKFYTALGVPGYEAGGVAPDMEAVYQRVNQIEDEDLRNAVGSMINVMNDAYKYGLTDQDTMGRAYNTLAMLEKYEGRRNQVITEYEQNEARISQEAENVFADDGFARAAASIGFSKNDYKSLTDEARKEALDYYKDHGNLDDWYIYDEETGEIREDMLRSTERPQVTWDRTVQEEAQERRDEQSAWFRNNPITKAVEGAAEGIGEAAKAVGSKEFWDNVQTAARTTADIVSPESYAAMYEVAKKEYLPGVWKDIKTGAQNYWAGMTGATTNIITTIGEILDGELVMRLTGNGDKKGFLTWGDTGYVKGLRQYSNEQAGIAAGMNKDFSQRLADGVSTIITDLGGDGESAKEAAAFFGQVYAGIFDNLGRMSYDMVFGLVGGAAGALTEMQNIAKAGASGIAALNTGGLISRNARWAAKGLAETMSSPGFISLALSQYGQNVDQMITEKKGVENLTAADYWFCLADGLFNSLIELGGEGGAQGLLTGKNSGRNFWTRQLKAVGQENLEEIGQGWEYKIFSNFRDVANGDTPQYSLFSVEDKDAIFSVAGTLDTIMQTSLQTLGMNAVYGAGGSITNIMHKVQRGEQLNEQETELALTAMAIAKQGTEAQQNPTEAQQHTAFDSAVQETAPAPNRETPREAEARQAETAAETIVQPAAPQAPTPEQTYRETARTAEELQEAEAAQAALARLQAESEQAAPERQTPTPEQRETARDQEAAQLRQEEARQAEEEQTEQTRKERQIPTPEQTGRGTIREQLDQMQREREAQRQTQPVITRQAPTPDMTNRHTTREQLEEQLQAERQIAEARAEALRRAGTPEEVVQQMLDQNEQAQEAQRRTFEAQQELERRQQAIDRAGTDPKAQREEQRRQAEEEKRARKEEKKAAKAREKRYKALHNHIEQTRNSQKYSTDYDREVMDKAEKIIQKDPSSMTLEEFYDAMYDMRAYRKFYLKDSGPVELWEEAENEIADEFLGRAKKVVEDAGTANANERDTNVIWDGLKEVSEHGTPEQAQEAARIMDDSLSNFKTWLHNQTFRLPDYMRSAANSAIEYAGTNDSNVSRDGVAEEDLDQAWDRLCDLNNATSDSELQKAFEEVLGLTGMEEQIDQQRKATTEEFREKVEQRRQEAKQQTAPDRQSPSTFQKETARVREEQQRQEEEARQSALDRLKSESQEIGDGKLDQEISPEVPAETEREDGNRRADEEITPEVPQETNANERADEEITSEVPEESNTNERAAEEVASEVPEETSTNERAAEEVAPEPPAETPQDQKAGEEIASEPPAETPQDQKANEEIVSEPPAETPQDQRANEEIASEPPAETPVDQKANEEIVSEPPAETQADQRANEEIASEPPAETANAENAKLEQDLAAEAPKSEQKVNNPFRELQENGRKVARQMGFTQYSQGSRDTGVQINTWSGSMSADQQAELRIVDDLTRSLGITAVVDSTAAQAGAEGFYNKSEKEGTVLHLMQDGKNPLRVTLGHEAYHMLENLNPKAAATVRSIFEKYAAKSGTSIDNLINEKMETYRKMGIQIKGTEAQIREYFRAEVVADSLYDVIGDTASVRALAVRDRGLVERIRDWVGQMMNRLRKMTDRYASNSREARILRDNVGAMEEARNALIQGLKDTEALQNAKKAALSLGQNSKTLSDFRDTMMNAQDDHEMNRGTRTLAGEILKQAGLENTTENIGKLVNAALDKESSGVTISEAMKDQGLTWQSSEENNRAFMTLARYMSALEDGGDISSIMEVMKGLDQDAEGQADTGEDIRYSISPDNNADITEGIGTPADNMNAPADNNTVEGVELTEAEARTLEEREGEVEQLQKELARSEDLVRDLAGQVLDAREEMRNLRQKEGVSREEINSLRRQLNNRRMESEARAVETSILEKKLAAAQKKLHDYQVQLTSEKKLWKAKIRGQIEQSAIHEKHMKELNKAKQTLIHMFEHPSSKKGYVPQAYQQEAANFVEAILNGQGAEVEEYGDRLSRFIREAQSKNGGVSPFGENTRRMLQETYDILKEAREDSKYDGMIHSLEEYKIGFIVNTAQAVVNDIKYENALRGREKNEDLARETLSWANTANRNPHKLSGIAGKSWSYLMKHMSGQTFFEVVGQHGDNAVTRAGEELSKGERKRKMIRMNSQKIFQPLTEGVNQKRFQEFTGKKAIWYDTGIRVMDKNGNLTDQTMKLTGDMRASLYMHWQAESNRKGMEIRQSEADKRNGLPQLYQLVMPDIELMKKGKEAEAYARGYRVVMNAGQIENILNEMTDYEKAWCAAWRKAEGEIWNPSLNETSLLANGYEIAKEPDYFTISRSGNYTAHEFETVVQDERISHMGTLKERVRSNIPMMLVGISRVTASQIDSVSKYSGMLIPIQNLTRIFNGVTAGYEDSVREATAKAFGMDAIKYIENIAQDLQGGRKTEDSFLDKLRGKYAGAVLTGNPAVIVKQAASYPAAAAVLGYKALGQNMQYFLAPGRISTDLIDRYTSAHYDRRSQNLKDLEGNAQRSGAGRFAHKMGNGIQGMDVLTTKVLWKACETWVKDNTNLKPGSEADIKAGTDAFYQAVGQKYDEVLEWTQPEYDPMQRNAIQRSGSQIVKAMTMFKTQSFQNANLLINGFTKYSDMKAALKANPNSETAQQNFKQAKTQLAQTVSSQVISAVVLGVLTAMGKAIYHKMRDYEDDKGDMTLESVGGQIMKDSLSSMAGMVAGGSELFDFISGLLEGKSPFDIEAAGISTINDLYQNTFSLLNSAQIIGDGDMSTAEKLKKLQPKLWNFAGSMAQLLGIPLNNARNLVDGIAANTKDFIEGKPGSYQESGLSFLGSAQGRETSNKAVAGYIAQAMMDGNQAEATRLYNEQLRQGKSADSLNTAIATWQKENIPEIRQAAEAIEGGDLDEYNRLIQEMTGMGLSMTNAVKYVEAERKKMKADTKETAKQAYTPMTYDQITAGMTKEESTTAYTNGMMNSLLEAGNVEDALQVRDAMIASGKTMSTIKSSLTSYWKPLIVQAYEDGDIAYVREMTEMLVKMGMNRDTVSGWTKGKSSSKSTTTYSFGKTTFGATGFNSTKNYYSSKSYKKRTKSTSNFGKSGTFGSGGSFGSGGFGK